jgi:hypothetical protein
VKDHWPSSQRKLQPLSRPVTRRGETWGLVLMSLAFLGVFAIVIYNLFFRGQS